MNLVRKVIDSNCLESEDLERFLAGSPKHIAVLTDYSAMEAYQQTAVGGLAKRMSLLCRYPRQVAVLKGTKAICGLSGRSAKLQDRMIDHAQTRGYGQWCNQLAAAAAGDLRFIRAIERHTTAADEHLNRVLRDAPALIQAVSLIAQEYSARELQAIRRNQVHSPAMAATLTDRLIRHVIGIAVRLFAGHPSVTRLPGVPEVYNTFIFRITFCIYLQTLERIRTGGGANTKPESIRNDMVDASFAAYGTFFNGLISRDGRAVQTHREARVLIGALVGERQAPFQ